MNQHQRNKAAGLCVNCCQPFNNPPRVTCAPCLERKRELYRQELERDPDKYKSRQYKEWNNKRNAATRLEVVNAYGGKCVCCGEDHYPYLELDHINGGGAAHRKSIGTSADAFYRAMRNQGYPPILQVLCANCHRAKTNGRGCKAHS